MFKPLATQQTLDYEYYGLMAATWDLLRGDTSNWPDRAYFRDLIRMCGQPALIVGSGTGRLLLDYLEFGLDVDGVDCSPEMLAVCEKKAHALGLEPTLYLQDFQHLELPRQYETIIVPSQNFQLLTNNDDAIEAMRSFYRHLRPGGTLAISFMNNSADEPNNLIYNTEWDLIAEALQPDGTLVRRWSRSTFDNINQLEHTEDRYEILEAGDIIHTEDHTRSPGARWYTPQQAQSIFEALGLKDIRPQRKFSFEFVEDNEWLFTVTGRRGS